jgi:LacI family transcriptional regulator
MIRIKDIARKAEVSPTTVSNVIHGNHKKVSEETVEKVEKLLAEMDYIPSMGARMLAGGSSRVIGILAGEPDEWKHCGEGHAFTNILIRSMESEIYRRNYYMLLHFTETPEEGIQFAATWNVEGLITLGFGTRENEKLQRSCKVPMVSIDTYYEKQKVANVGLDDVNGGYLMAEYLLETGHRRIAFLSDNDIGVDHERWKGVCMACREKGLEERYGSGKGLELSEGNVRKAGSAGGYMQHIIIPKGRKRRIAFYEKNLARLSQEYDALFFASDYYAVEALAGLDDMGIRVPYDVSVAGFDDTESSRMCRPRLTTVHQDVEEKARRAVKKLFEFIQGGREISLADKLPVKLVIRDSVENRRVIVQNE